MIPIVVNSCDNHEFIWGMWKYFLGKYWNFNAFPIVYFLTEEKSIKFNNEHIINLNIGRKPWSNFIFDAIDILKSEYMFFMMDDHIPIKMLDTKVLNDIYNIFLQRNFDRFGIMMKYHPLQEPCVMCNINNYDVYMLLQQSGYISSFQPSFWKTSFFKDIIEDNWTPWDGELKGTEKARHLPSLANVGYTIQKKWYLEALTHSKPIIDNWNILIKMMEKNEI